MKSAIPFPLSVLPLPCAELRRRAHGTPRNAHFLLISCSLILLPEAGADCCCCLASIQTQFVPQNIQQGSVSLSPELKRLVSTTFPATKEIHVGFFCKPSQSVQLGVPGRFILLLSFISLETPLDQLLVVYTTQQVVVFSCLALPITYNRLACLGHAGSQDRDLEHPPLVSQFGWWWWSCINLRMGHRGKVSFYPALSPYHFLN